MGVYYLKVNFTLPHSNFYGEMPFDDGSVIFYILLEVDCILFVFTCQMNLIQLSKHSFIFKLILFLRVYKRLNQFETLVKTILPVVMILNYLLHF